jgi:hypothetical protein
MQIGTLGLPSLWSIQSAATAKVFDCADDLLVLLGHPLKLLGIFAGTPRSAATPPSNVAAVLPPRAMYIVRRLLIVWPGVTQTLFIDRAFVGDEQGLVRVMGLTVVVIGWLYLFGGRSGGRQVVAASVVDRLIFAPGVLVPLAIAGVFPHLLLAFACLDVALAIGAWVIFGRVT